MYGGRAVPDEIQMLSKKGKGSVIVKANGMARARSGSISSFAFTPSLIVVCRHTIHRMPFERGDNPTPALP